MRVLRHPGELHALPSELRRLLERRLRQLQSDDWGEFILVEPGDGINELDHQCGGWLVYESGEFDPPYEWLAHHPGARCFFHDAQLAQPQPDVIPCDALSYLQTRFALIVLNGDLFVVELTQDQE